MAWYKCTGGSGGSATLITKSITTNGTYNASSDNADGYSQVTVNVGGGIGYTEAWIVANTSASNIPTTTTHFTYSGNNITSFDIKSNAGNTNVVMGDITSYIGNNSSWKWKVTATAAMTIRIYDVINQTLGPEQVVAANTDIITDGASSGSYCMEIRRYS